MIRLLKKLVYAVSLEEKLAWSFAVGIVVIVLLGASSLLALHESRLAELEMERTHEIRESLHRLVTELDDIQDGTRGYVITGDAEFLKGYLRAIVQVPRERAELQTLLSEDENQTKNFQALSPVLDEFLRSFPEYIAKRRMAGYEAAAQMTRSRMGLRWMEKLRNGFDSIDGEQNRLLKERNAHHEIVEARHKETLLSAGIIGLLLLLAAFLRIRFELSDRKKTQQRLLESSKMAALGEMAAGIAHEINNPLGIIRGRAQVLRLLSEKGQATERKVRESCTNIEETVTRIANIVTGLLSFSRNEQGEELRIIMLDPLLESTIELCKARFKQRNVEIKVSRPANPIEFRCRPVQLSQVLLNLLNNAFDAAQESLSAGPWVELRIEESPSTLRFAVTDSGPGVPAELQGKIMEPFFTTKELGKGTGLGLSVSKGIVEGHGGKLLFLGNDPHTCFEVCIPK